MDSTPASNEALLTAAIAAFGARGLEGASTRDIARAAGKPMSAITYHFGGKEGLYLACARHIADTIAGILGPGVTAANPEIPADPAAARATLRQIFQAFVGAMVRPESASFASFVSREQMEPTAAFTILYDTVMGHVAGRVAGLLIVVSAGRISLIDAQVRTIALLGQVLAFRLARAAVLRSTGWADVGPAETAQIDAAVQTHLAAILDSLEQGNSL